jgi:hypothetical protein
VFIFQRDGVAALLNGDNPYTLTFPDIYGGTSNFYGPGMSVGGRLQFGFIYPPLSLFLAIPGYLLGDVRYSHLFAMAIAAALMASARPGRLGFLAATIYLFSPRTFLMVERAWTEPFVVALLALVVFCACRWRRGLPIALGLFLASKQYLVLAVPALALLWPKPVDRHDLRATIVRGAIVAGTVSLPLALWDFPAFWYAVGALQVHQPFRDDALTFLAALAWLTGVRLPSVLGFVAAAVAIVVALRCCSRTPSGFCAGLALIYFAFFAFSKQAFCNYYYFVLGALCISVAVWPSEEKAEPEHRLVSSRIAARSIGSF